MFTLLLLAGCLHQRPVAAAELAPRPAAPANPCTDPGLDTFQRVTGCGKGVLYPEVHTWAEHKLIPPFGQETDDPHYEVAMLSLVSEGGRAWLGSERQVTTALTCLQDTNDVFLREIQSVVELEEEVRCWTATSLPDFATSFAQISSTDLWLALGAPIAFAIISASGMMCR